MSDNTDALVEALADGEFEYVPVDELHGHPENEEVYGDIDPDESFVDDFRQNGVETPLVVNEHDDTEAEWGLPNTVIGGHRRLEAARRAELKTVPVRWKQYPEPTATRRLVQNNKQREKTPGQVAREALTLEETAREVSQAAMGERTDLRARGHEGGQSKRWDKEVADDLGVGQRTVRRATDIYRFAYPDEYVHDQLQNVEKYDVPEEVREEARRQIEMMDEGEQGFKPAYEEVKQAEREYEEQQKREERDQSRQSAYQNAEETVELRHGDFRDVLDSEPDASIDHIVTDPPYDADALEQWAALGAHAARVLKPGGFLIAYSGKAHLPDVHDVLSSHLNYHWQAIVNHSGPGAKIFSRNLRTGYKPILIYTKGDADVQEDFVTDVLEGGGREKDSHDWQQAESEAAQLIESFTEINDCICDPMCGSGTIGVAADRLDRRCLLIDEDRDAVETARRKVMPDE